MISRLKKLGLLMLVFLPTVALAAAGDIVNSRDNPGGLLARNIFNQENTVGGVIIGVLQLFLGVVGLISVAMIVYGGFRYITSVGNSEVAQAAKKTITNAIIGLVIIILSFVIVTVITNLAFGIRG
jgi:cytochrome bd-type quinol oxidase subunit 2